jgi:hypothetical protein
MMVVGRMAPRWSQRAFAAVCCASMCGTSLAAQTETFVLPTPLFDVSQIAQQSAEPPTPALFSLGQGVQPPAGPPPTPRHTGIKAMFRGLATDVRHLPSKTNLFWVGVGSGLALAAHPFDDNVNRAMVGSTTADRVFRPGKILGQIAPLLGTASIVYAVGRTRDQPRVSHVGMDLIRSLVISHGLTMALKATTRRERPDMSDKNSFPSGHAADTFAFATALERHLGWRFAVPAYVMSSYVAISRLPSNRHWLSDAVFGSAVGIIAGRTVTRPGDDVYPVAVAIIPGGVAVTYVRHRD